MLIEVQTGCDAPRDVVWDVLVDWERQPEWMVDARAVQVVSDHRTGTGVTLRCPTSLLGVTVEDVMRVTAWDTGSYLEVVHLGSVITGRGAFELEDRAGGGTRIVWWEAVDPPLGRLGEWSATALVAPMTRRLFRRSLRNLARLAEAARPHG